MPPVAEKNKNKPRAPLAKRRKYNSPVREQQSIETRENIIAAGSELVRKFTGWDWTNLTAKAVGEHARLSERTVRRYFSSESLLRDAVLERLVDESGVVLSNLELNNFAANVARLFRYLQSFAIERSASQDPTFAALDKKRMNALKAAVTQATKNWSAEQRETVSAALDILWQPALYERLTVAWEFETDRAISTITWLIELILAAVTQNRAPNIKA